MGCVIVEAGILTTVQDLGRRGYLDKGFGPSGAMDARAASLANALVGNDAGASVLECAVKGPRIIFAEPTVIALAGAPMRATLDGHPVAMGTATAVPAGGELALGAQEVGAWTYLAVARGGFAVPCVLGSASTSMRYGMGGHEGRALRAGDVLDYVPCALDAVAREAEPVPAPDALTPAFVARGAVPWVRAVNDGAYLRPCPDGVVDVHVVMGPQDHLFTSEGIAAFLGGTYVVGARSDRMGYRLQGPAIQARAGSDIVSDGIVAGSIQVPADGQPIVLMADRQVTGGYAKVATVATVDLPRMAQCRAGTRVRFVAIDVRRAQALLRAQASAMRFVREALGTLDSPAMPSDVPALLRAMGGLGMEGFRLEGVDAEGMGFSVMLGKRD